MIPSLGAADVARLCPRADPRWAAALVTAWPELVAIGELTTPTRARHFLAQCAEESGGFRVFEENLSYSAERMAEVWPRRFPTVAAATPYARQPARLAEIVYGGRRDLGNTQPGDGWRFHGRGPIQATGRAWSERLSKALGLDLVARPELMLDPVVGWKSAAAIWKLDGCNAFADRGDFVGETRRLNGGLTNLAERQRYLAVAGKLAMRPASGAVSGASPSAISTSTPQAKETSMDLFGILRPAIAAALETALAGSAPGTIVPPTSVAASAGAIAAEAASTIAADPTVQHVTNQEPWYQSRVTLGALVSAAASIGGIFGMTLSPENRDAIVTLIVAVGGIMGPAITLYGRWAAKVPLAARPVGRA